MAKKTRLYTGKLAVTFSTNSIVHKLAYVNTPYIMRTYSDRLKAVNDAIRAAVRQEFWPYKAEQMQGAWQSRRGRGPDGASNPPYPRWVALTKRYMRSKKNEDFWVKKKRFTRWLAGIASGAHAPGRVWNVMTVPGSLHYVQYVNDGWMASGNGQGGGGSSSKKRGRKGGRKNRNIGPRWIPGRPIFVFFKSDLTYLQQVVRRAVSSVFFGRKSTRRGKR
jgi:hypothetical protein